jgi:hypothetical protein
LPLPDNDLISKIDGSGAVVFYNCGMIFLPVRSENKRIK